MLYTAILSSNINSLFLETDPHTLSSLVMRILVFCIEKQICVYEYLSLLLKEVLMVLY